MSTEPVTVTISGATIYDAAGKVTGNSFSFSSVAWDTENNKFVDATVTFSGILADTNWKTGTFSESFAVIGGTFSKNHSYTSSNYEDKSLLYYDVTVSGAQGPAVQTTGPIYIVGGTYSNITMGGSGSSGGAAFRSRGENADVFAITQKTTVINGKEVKFGTLITGNTATSGIGGAIHTFQNGTKWYIDGATFSYNTSGHDYVDGNTKTGGARGGGAICDQASKCTTVKNTLFDNNYAVWRGGAVTVMNSTNNFSAYNCRFIDNNAGKDGGAIYYNAGTLTVSNCYFENNNAVEKGGAIYVNGSNAQISDSVFATATDDIYNSGKVYFSGNIKLNASLLGNDGIYYIADGTNFTIGGKDVSLYGLDFSNATITVDGTGLAAGDVIATNIGGIGNYVINNKANAYLELAVVDNDLMLKEIDAAISSGDVQTSYTGNGLTVMDGGEVGTLFATKGDEKEIATKISGGKVESNLVAGAYAKFAEVGKAVIGKVELNISDLADVAGKVYAGGYLYGNGAESAEAQMEVAEVNVTLDGGKVSTNMFGGAHAREYGNANIETVNITVTDGSHGRIYAGGWAEKGAESHVGTSNVIISGGTVDYLYGAGANADGETYVTTTNITIENDAVVNTIFMGGRYGYSYVNTVNLTFAGENKELTRLSGVSSAGMDYANATVVELATDVTADLIDYVDKFVINEDCKLTAVDEFYLGDRNNETGATEDFTTFDFIADGEANWTAVAGISDFTNAKFSVNGAGLTTWDGESVKTIGDYTLTYDAEKKTITLANA